MAYVDRQTGTSRAASIATVGIIHAAIGLALVYGLAAEFVRRIDPGPIIAINLPLPKPPPSPKPTAAHSYQPDRPTTTGPQTDPLVTPTNTTAPQTGGDEFPIGPTTTSTDAYIPPPPPSPQPLFTPQHPKVANDRSRWVTTDDYPRGDLVRDHVGTVQYRVVVGSNGRVASCEITGSSGFAGLDAATCRNVTARARFTPGTNGAGEPVVDTYVGRVLWEIPR